MCRHAEAGDKVSVLYLSTGLAARSVDGQVSRDETRRLREAAKAAADIIGISHMEFADFPDNRMDTVALLDVIKRVEAFIDSSEAEIVYTHYVGDLNIDHSITARAVLTACRPVPGTRVRKVYAGEVLSSSEYALPQDRFRPTSYVGIADYLERKRTALECYTTEVRDWPHPRSIEGIATLARLRGSECGLDAAEAFILLKELRP